MEFLGVLVTELYGALLLVLVGVATYLAKGVASVAIEYLKVKLGLDQFEQLKETALMIVRAVEQSPAWRDFDNPVKKDKAVLFVLETARKLNIPLTPEEAEILVEEAVKVMRGESPPDIVIEA